MQGLSNTTFVSIRYMADADRRRRLIAYFETVLKGDRARLIAKSGLTHGRISQLFDTRQSFGERSAANLATKLGLAADYFEHDTPLSAEATALAAAFDRMQPVEKARLKLLMQAALESVNSLTPASPAPTCRPADLTDRRTMATSPLQWAEQLAQWDQWAADLQDATRNATVTPNRPAKGDDH